MPQDRQSLWVLPYGHWFVAAAIALFVFTTTGAFGLHGLLDDGRLQFFMIGFSAALMLCALMLRSRAAPDDREPPAVLARVVQPAQIAPTPPVATAPAMTSASRVSPPEALNAPPEPAPAAKAEPAARAGVRITFAEIKSLPSSIKSALLEHIDSVPMRDPNTVTNVDEPDTYSVYDNGDKSDLRRILK
jgi:hypothetical protein